MPGVDAWCALAEEVVATHDPALESRAEQALVAFGMTDDERAQLVATIRGREDPAGLLLGRIAAQAHTEPSTDGPDGGAPTPTRWTPRSPCRRSCSPDPTATMAARLGQAARDVLANLPADAAGLSRLGTGLRSLSLPDPAMRTAASTTVVDVTREASMGRLPVASVVTDVVAANLSDGDRDLVARLLARASSPRLLSGVLDSLRGGADPTAVVALLDRVAALRDTHTPPPAAVDPEIGLRSCADAAGPGLARRCRPPRDRPKPHRHGAATRRRPANRLPADRRRRPPRGPARGRGHRRAVRRRGRPGQVPGRGDHPDRRDTVHGGRDDRARAGAGLRSELACRTRRYAAHPEVTDADPYPTATVPFVAQYRPDLPSERRIGVHYIVSGQVVGIAWRTVVAVPYTKDVATAPTPKTGPDALMDLQPLLGVDLPDLILRSARPTAPRPVSSSGRRMRALPT